MSQFTPFAIDDIGNMILKFSDDLYVFAGKSGNQYFVVFSSVVAAFLRHPGFELVEPGAWYSMLNIDRALEAIDEAEDREYIAINDKQAAEEFVLKAIHSIDD